MVNQRHLLNNKGCETGCYNIRYVTLGKVVVSSVNTISLIFVGDWTQTLQISVVFLFDDFKTDHNHILHHSCQHTIHNYPLYITTAVYKTLFNNSDNKPIIWFKDSISQYWVISKTTMGDSDGTIPVTKLWGSMSMLYSLLCDLAISCTYLNLNIWFQKCSKTCNCCSISCNFCYNISIYLSLLLSCCIYSSDCC